MEVVTPAESRCFTSDNTAGGAPEIIAAVAEAASGARTALWHRQLDFERTTPLQRDL